MTVTTMTLNDHYLPRGIQYALINDSSGNLTIVAGQALKTIDVWGAHLTSSGTSVIKMQSSTGPTDLWVQNINTSQNLQVQVPWGDANIGQNRAWPMVQTASGDGLILQWTNAATITGVVYYQVRVTTQL